MEKIGSRVGQSWTRTRFWRNWAPYLAKVGPLIGENRAPIQPKLGIHVANMRPHDLAEIEPLFGWGSTWPKLVPELTKIKPDLTKLGPLFSSNRAPNWTKSGPYFSRAGLHPIQMSTFFRLVWIVWSILHRFYQKLLCMWKGPLIPINVRIKRAHFEVIHNKKS